MKEFAANEWQRAVDTLESGRRLAEKDPDSAASRAFYTAFHALTALFALRGQSFSKHSALRAALHRELINTKEWPEDLGSTYDYLLEMRETGDYGGMMHVSQENARLALQNAERILEAVKHAYPELEEGQNRNP